MLGVKAQVEHKFPQFGREGNGLVPDLALKSAFLAIPDGLRQSNHTSLEGHVFPLEVE